jgi:hypothetical protein
MSILSLYTLTNYDTPWMGFRFDDGDGRDVCSLIITSGNDDAADNSIDWEPLQQFLLTHMNQKTANDRLKTIKELYPTKQIGVLFDFFVR